MEEHIEQYLVDYIFQRFELDSPIVYEAKTRTIVYKEFKITVPELRRNKEPLLVTQYDIAMPYCRYTNTVELVGTGADLQLTYDLLGEVYDHLTLTYEKEGLITSSTEAIFYPILDMKIKLFTIQLKTFVSMPYKSFNGKNFLVGVSHDIDRTGDSFKYRLITYFFQTLKQKRPLLFLKGLFGKNEENNFEYIIDKENNFGTSSTWFVLTRYGLKLNADYHTTDKEFKKALTLLKDNDREIGIHIPYMELSVEDVKYEFNKLDNSNEMGMRMHHLRGEYEELMQLLNEAKIPYDSTFGLNECMSYRFGTSVPFHPIIKGKILEHIYEIPMNIMDLQITDAEKYQKELSKLFFILNEVGGVCILNWHNNRFNRTKYGSIWIDTFTISLDETLKHNGHLTNMGQILKYYS